MKEKTESMKKIMALVLVTVFAYACGSGPAAEKKPISVNVNPQIEEGQNAAASTSAAAAPGAATAAAVPSKDGKALIASSDCLACHNEHNKLVGPSYADVAKKYKEADIPHLVKKIIDGGAGAWGEIPMSPHPTLAPDDAEAMVKYILTVK